MANGSKRGNRGHKKSSSSLLPFVTIQAAVTGDEEAIRHILVHYDRYLTNLASTEVPDEEGEMQRIVDYDLKERLTAKLMEAILHFDLNKGLKAEQ